MSRTDGRNEPSQVAKGEQREAIGVGADAGKNWTLLSENEEGKGAEGRNVSSQKVTRGKQWVFETMNVFFLGIALFFGIAMNRSLSKRRG